VLASRRQPAARQLPDVDRPVLAMAGEPTTARPVRLIAVATAVAIAALIAVTTALAEGTAAGLAGDASVDLPTASELVPPPTSGSPGAASDGPDGAADAPVWCDRCERWRLTFEGSITSTAVTDRVLVVGTTSGRVRSIDADTGRLRWTTQVGARPVHALPVNELVVVGSQEGRLVGLERASGAPRWDVAIDGPGLTARAVVGDADGVLVFTGPPTAREIVAVEARTGAIRWRRELDRRWTAVGQGVVATIGDRLERWLPASGEPAWSYTLADGEELVGRAEGRVVTRSAEGTRWLDADSGAVVLDVSPGVTWWASAPDGTLVLADTTDDARIIALDPDGATRWETDLPGPASPGGCCVEVVPTPDGRILAVDRRVPGRAVLLDAASGDVLDERPGLATQDPDLLLTAATGDLGIQQGAGEVRGVSLRTGALRWRFPDASVVVSIDPLVVSGRHGVAGPDPVWLDDAAEDAAARAPGSGVLGGTTRL
jgi:outer membrane protein assembly factor BamB